MRDAASLLCVPFSKLQKMETGGRFRLAGLDLNLALADLYGRPQAELLHEIGIGMLPPDVVETGDARNRALAALVLHPDLRPLHMDLGWTDSCSPLQKVQWMEFAQELAAVL